MIRKENKIIDNLIIKVEISLLDNCQNGWDSFGMNVELFDSKGKLYNKTIKYQNKIYFEKELNDDDIKNIISKYFPEFIPFLLLVDKDIFGMPSYCVQNMMYYLSDNKFDLVCQYLNIDNITCFKIATFTKYGFCEFLKHHIQTVTKPIADEAIKLLEKLTNTTYEKKDFVSPILFNEMHYCLVTKEKGWNNYKELKNKKSLTYEMINTI